MSRLFLFRSLSGLPAVRLSAFFMLPVLACAPARAGTGMTGMERPAPAVLPSFARPMPQQAGDGAMPGMADMPVPGRGEAPSPAGPPPSGLVPVAGPVAGEAHRPGASGVGGPGRATGRTGPAPASPRIGSPAGRMAASGMAHGMKPHGMAEHGMAGHGMAGMDGTAMPDRRARVQKDGVPSGRSAASSAVSAHSAAGKPEAGMAMADMAGATRGKKPHVVHKAVDAPGPVVDLGHHMHAMDMGRWFHGVLDEFEGRYQGGGNSSLRWDGEAWYGGDYNRLWLKSEGTMTRGRVRDGDQELLYSRAISTYFNLQGGVRLDIDSGPVRAWGAFGVEGLALYQFEMQATGYFNDRGVAGRLEGSYDILLTNRLILQPQVELNFYSHADPARQVGRGLADIDTGLRLRYELWRKMAPYVAVTYDSPLTQGRRMARQRGERASEARFTFGIRSWF